MKYLTSFFLLYCTLLFGQNAVKFDVDSRAIKPTSLLSSNITKTASGINLTYDAEGRVEISSYDANRVFLTERGAVNNPDVNSANVIQSALDSLEPGDILVFDGLFGVGAAGWDGLTLSEKTNITIEAREGCGIKALYAADTQKIQGFPFFLKISNSSNIVVRGITFNGNSIVSGFLGMDGTTRCKIIDNYVYNHGGIAAIMTIGCRENLYKRNTVRGGVTSSSRGFWFGDNDIGKEEKYSRIVENIAIDNGHTGFGGDYDRCVVAENQSIRNGCSGFAIAGDITAPSQYTTFVGNVAIGNQCHGFQSDTVDDQEMQGICLIGNISQSNKFNGIFLNTARNWTIKGNQLNNNEASGIAITLSHGISVTENIIFDEGIPTTTYGIYLNAADVANGISDIIISENVITNVGTGIRIITYGSPGSGSDINVLNNVSRGNAIGFQLGTGYEKVSLVNNTFLNNSSYDLRHDVDIMGLNNRYETEYSTSTTQSTLTEAITLNGETKYGVTLLTPSGGTMTGPLVISKDADGEDVLLVIGSTTGQSVNDAPYIESNSGATATAGGSARFGAFSVNATDGQRKTDFVIEAANQADGDVKGKFWIKSDGKAGILTNTPVATLSINGSLQVGGGGVVAGFLTATATLDFPSTPAKSSSMLTITLSGVATQDPIVLTPSASAIYDNSFYSATVYQANVIRVKFDNYSSAAINPDSASFRVLIFKY